MTTPQKTGPLRCVLAAAHSGSGKTTVASLLCLALRARGLSVQPFKIGPDYLDPTHLSRAAGKEARTLDSFLLPPQRLQTVFDRSAANADIAVIEGVMGLYDGRHSDSSKHSTAHLARVLQAPVILVMDASGMSRTVAALAQGLRDFGLQDTSLDTVQAAPSAALNVAGVILNRVGSVRHAQLCQAALEQAGIPCFGFVLRDEALHLPARYLGLVSAQQAAWDEQAALHATRYLELDALLATLSHFAIPITARTAQTTPAPPRCRIAYAYDEAFHFYYPDGLDELRAQGAQLLPFSPLRDQHVPQADGLLLGGGYPEAHAEALSRNASMLQSVRAFAASGTPVVAECGGLMYLAKTLEDLSGQTHTLCGVVPYHTRMSAKVLLGYREAQALQPSPLLETGQQVRGHEFHFSALTHAPTHPAYQWQTPQGTVREGYAQGNILASYLHLHYAQGELARHLVQACMGGRQLQRQQRT